MITRWTAALKGFSVTKKKLLGHAIENLDFSERDNMITLFPCTTWAKKSKFKREIEIMTQL